MDKRKNNGGNSTAAKGFDKRKNQYKEVLEQALEPKDIVNVIKMLHDKSINEEDTAAAKILLEYYIGRPNQSIDVTTNGESIKQQIINIDPLSD
jgi:hypothetical protein